MLDLALDVAFRGHLTLTSTQAVAALAVLPGVVAAWWDVARSAVQVRSVVRLRRGLQARVELRDQPLRITKD